MTLSGCLIAGFSFAKIHQIKHLLSFVFFIFNIPYDELFLNGSSKYDEPHIDKNFDNRIFVVIIWWKTKPLPLS